MERMLLLTKVKGLEGYGSWRWQKWIGTERKLALTKVKEGEIKKCKLSALLIKSTHPSITEE